MHILRVGKLRLGVTGRGHTASERLGQGIPTPGHLPALAQESPVTTPHFRSQISQGALWAVPSKHLHPGEGNDRPPAPALGGTAGISPASPYLPY